MAGPVAVRKGPSTSTSIERANDATKSEHNKPHDQPLSDSVGTNTSRGFDDLAPHERDQFLHEIEIDFRRHLSETSTRTGFVIYPNTRQLLRAVSTLYQTLSTVDLSDIAL